MSSRCPHNIVNFGPLAAEIGLPVWGTPANFNGFHDLPALLHGSQVVSVNQTASLNRQRHLCSAERPSRWALAHILEEVYTIFVAPWLGSDYTGWPKKFGTIILYTLTLPNINRFSKSFTNRIRTKFVIILSLKIPPHQVCRYTTLWNVVS